MQETLLTVITPVYNAEHFIIDTIKSVINSIDKDLMQYIVVNDGSTDSSLELINEFADQITLFSQSNLGEAQAINNAISASRGKYILVVNADDPVLSAKLFSESIHILENMPTIVATYPDWKMIDEHGDLVHEVKALEFSRETLIGGFICIPGPGAIFRKEVAMAIGGRNSGYKFVSDYDFWLRLSQFGDFKHIPKTLAIWRRHSDSTSIKGRTSEMAFERILVIKEFLQDFPQSSKIERSARANSLYNAALLSCFEDGLPTRKWVLEAIRVQRNLPSEAKFRAIIFLLIFPNSRRIFQLVRKVPVVAKFLRIEGLLT
jgi:glycosyltransferase involved in cell wall biosynthesis